MRDLNKYAEEEQALAMDYEKQSSSSSSSEQQREKEEEEEEQQDGGGMIGSDVIRDAILGLSDGLTVPFALTAGLTGTGSPRVIVLAGFAELTSGAISMGIGGALGAHAERQHARATRKRFQERALQMSPYAIERALNTAMSRFHISPRIATDMAKDLDEDRESLGHLLLQLEEGASEDEGQSNARVGQAGLVIGIAYLVGGFIPLLPYVFFETVQNGLICSVVVTAIALLVFGAVKEKLVGGTSGWRGQLWSALSTLSVGIVAAGSSCLIVRALEG